MRTGRFFWKLFLGNALLLAGVVGACLWLFLSQLDRIHEATLTDYLQSQAQALALTMRDHFGPPYRDELDAFAKALRGEGGGAFRVTFITADGIVLGDSHAHPAEMESHADRPEVREALDRGAGSSRRWSRTLGQEFRYVARRVDGPDGAAGVVRVAVPVQSIGLHAATDRRVIWAIAGVSLLAAIGLALGLAQLWSRRIKLIRDAARSLSRRDFSTRIRVSGSDEVADLARSLNQMRDDITRQLATIDRQRRTLQSLVAQLHEGVIVASHAGDLVVVNAEAARLLHMVSPRSDGTFEGLPVEICIPQHEVQQLLHSDRKPLREAAAAEVPVSLETNHSSGNAVESKFQVEGPTGSLSLLARAFDIALPDAAVKASEKGSVPSLGRLVVITDVTKLAQTMQIKADFAANASHELRTPLSAIRVAVDTLRTLDPAGDGAAFRHFVDVIDRQSGRMEAMVADLLDLSRVESPTSHFVPARVSTEEVVDELYAAFAEALVEKELHWTAEIAAEAQYLVVSMDLLRIVLRNLIENAIRFTPAGGQVSMTVTLRGGSHVISIADTGCGIPAAEQNRVFERFYQVERARSGSNRGTGLGLSIVRHAVTAMQGTVRLESAAGKGTRVEVTIPARQVLPRRLAAASAKES
ncbi:MAG: HAMP domain-containing protein [Phycisphaerae bacterium]|nr:HAMP domain-containing protein [Phycisphaerae bacterium]